MTLDQNNYNGLMLKLFEVLNSSHSGGIRALLEGLLNSLMKLERENAIQQSLMREVLKDKDMRMALRDAF